MLTNLSNDSPDADICAKCGHTRYSHRYCNNEKGINTVSYPGGMYPEMMFGCVGGKHKRNYIIGCKCTAFITELEKVFEDAKETSDN